MSSIEWVFPSVLKLVTSRPAVLAEGGSELR
jgi:hypothetical protein